ncbi:tRNA (adenine22-N1)-methyltransferase [Gracilibacillus halotolerans]|uniref:tRNA (Adenine22-N1)-methyltransferase n=1 Tax=Gracilibacillus halotolerans TaxID=74386 RepID=A0A841RH54_9BACI|nr:tRNA (adenine(22)-N(1))-methyltransferase TrmK [Gracilibacillus halotolerans]MBB6511809.1 tRNA (adenine22-N1)-methyltransferase [Gracilibacillus halotolerans]
MISKRLKRIADYLVDPIYFADIGSDHAYLPTFVCSNNPLARAIAGELNRGPYERAVQTVKEHNLENKIEVRQGNGLEVLTVGEVNQVVIAGMGGKLIKKILEEGKQKLDSVSRLILQPNLDAPLVRKWLHLHSYEITAEEIVEEDGYIYELIIADKVEKTVQLDEISFLFGPFLLKEKGDIFQAKWVSELGKRKRLVKQMEKATNTPDEKINHLLHEITLIKEVLDDDIG